MFLQISVHIFIPMKCTRISVLTGILQIEMQLNNRIFNILILECSGTFLTTLCIRTVHIHAYCVFYAQLCCCISRVQVFQISDYVLHASGFVSACGIVEGKSISHNFVAGFVVVCRVGFDAHLCNAAI
jgi:hypothetical protein